MGLGIVLLAITARQVVAAESPGATAAAEKEHRPGQLVLDDAPLPLSAGRSDDAARREKAEALALFSAARSAELREQYADALRLYQRAFRCDPRSAEIVRAIIPLAIHLKRDGVAVRYALKSAELEENLDPTLLRRLAVRLEEEADLTEALKLFQRALSLRAGTEPNTADDVVLRMETGRLLALTGKYKQAADCLAVVADALDHPDKYSLSEDMRKVLLDDKQSIYNFFGDCFLEAGRIDEARSAFEKARQHDSDDGLWKFHLAQVLAESGKPAEALAALDEALPKHLSNAGTKPYGLLEELLAAMGRKTDLIGRLERLRESDRQNSSLGYFLAEKYLAAGMVEKAELLYAELLETEPSLAGYKSLLAIYRNKRQFEPLLSVLGEVVEGTGDLNVLGAETLSFSKDPEAMRGLIDAGRKQLKHAADKPPFGKCFALGFLALDAKQWEMASEFFEAAVNARPDKATEVFVVWGVGLLTGNQSAEAEKVFKQAIDKAKPENKAIFYFYLAGALALEDRTDEALSAARTAAEMKKDSVRFRSRVAWVYFHAKRYDEAVAEYLKIVNDCGNNYESDENRDSLKDVRMELSNICVLQKKAPQAVEWLEQVLDEFPDDVGAMNDLGYIWADEGRRLPQALTLIRKAAEAEPDNGAYRDSLGWVLYRLGRWSEAIAELQKAAELQPDGEIYDHLGEAYARFHQADKARDAWEKAAELLRKDKNEEKADVLEAKIRNIDKEIKQNRI
jgi:tetratricopeptide (TPR) repeat protein